ncbi:hypothetical protein ALC57_00606 [Trachymyrmex cornetzi]|uniref:Uncharacterized protein n=1 Tax=Trachymyrmex cornetzi TaxID=471704 RepID=A0A151JRF2_9HYME|nr:hypothetical protein ALC57_00606 [Trachymyrmex cornetzi]
MNRKETRFLGVWLDGGLGFHKQVNEIRGRVDKANAILKYLSKISKGVEVNTALLLYKSLVQSVTDYGIFVYYPRERSIQLKLERTQFKGIRTALGYRNSTPNNVLIAEAKVMLLRDRADMLARNFLSKIFVYGEEELRTKLSNLKAADNYARFRQPQLAKCIIVKAWERIVQLRLVIGPPKKFEIFDCSYDALTEKIEIDTLVGMRRKSEKGFTDMKMIQVITELYDLDRDSVIIQLYIQTAQDENSLDRLELVLSLKIKIMRIKLA